MQMGRAIHERRSLLLILGAIMTIFETLSSKNTGGSLVCIAQQTDWSF